MICEFVNGRPLPSSRGLVPATGADRRSGTVLAEERGRGAHSDRRGRGRNPQLDCARAPAGRPRRHHRHRRRAGARRARARKRRLRIAAHRYPHAGHGWHHAGARGRTQPSCCYHRTDDGLCRSARAGARPRCADPRRHHQAVLARRDAPRGQRRALRTAAAQALAATGDDSCDLCLLPSDFESGGHRSEGAIAPTPRARQILEIPQQPLDVVQLELRAEVLAEAAAQFFQNAPRALHVDLARHLDRGVVAVFTPAQGPPERIGLLLGARRPEPAGLAVGAGAQHALLLHGLGEVLRAPAQSFERPALGIDRAVRIAFSELTFRLAHGFAGAAELIHLALPLLALAKALLAQLLHQFLELIAQRLLILAQFAHLVALLALLALLTLLALLAALSALAVAPLVLALLERAIAQLLLLADHVAELVERRHHVIVAVIHLLPGTGHLQVFQHLLQVLQHPARGIPGAGARHLLEPIDHVAQILRTDLARIGIERARELLRILAHLLRQRLHELVERGTQLVGEPLDLLITGAALQRLAQRFFRRAQSLLSIGDAAILQMHGHVPHARDDVTQLIVALGARQLPEDRAQAEIDVALHVELFGRQGERIERGEHARLRIGVERQYPPLLDQRARDGLGERPLRKAEFERLALAFVARLVARGQNHCHVAASPRMLGQIFGALSDAVFGARLRQHQREVGRVVERSRRMAVGSVAVEKLEHRLRANDAVVVLELVGELQRPAHLTFRLLGERDGGRLVRDGGELPGNVARGSAANSGRSGIVDDEATLPRTLGIAALRAGGRLGKAASCNNVEVNSGRADD